MRSSGWKTRLPLFDGGFVSGSVSRRIAGSRGGRRSIDGAGCARGIKKEKNLEFLLPSDRGALYGFGTQNVPGRQFYFRGSVRCFKVCHQSLSLSPLLLLPTPSQRMPGRWWRRSVTPTRPIVLLSQRTVRSSSGPAMAVWMRPRPSIGLARWSRARGNVALPLRGCMSSTRRTAGTTRYTHLRSSWPAARGSRHHATAAYGAGACRP
jgi:hypothetical protein